MENKKFEQLIDLIINEDEEQAKELFHDIVVAKSKEIYESIMEELLKTKTKSKWILKKSLTFKAMTK